MTALEVIEEVTKATERDILELTGYQVKVIVLGIDQSGVGVILGLTPLILAKIITDALELPEGTISRKGRMRMTIIARQIYIKLMCDFFRPLTLKQIASFIYEGYDHTDVIWSKTQAAIRIDTDPEFKECYNIVLQAIEAWQKEQ